MMTMMTMERMSERARARKRKRKRKKKGEGERQTDGEKSSMPVEYYDYLYFGDSFFLKIRFGRFYGITLPPCL